MNGHADVKSRCCALSHDHSAFFNIHKLQKHLLRENNEALLLHSIKAYCLRRKTKQCECDGQQQKQVDPLMKIAYIFVAGQQQAVSRHLNISRGIYWLCQSSRCSIAYARTSVWNIYCQVSENLSNIFVIAIHAKGFLSSMANNDRAIPQTSYLKALEERRSRCFCSEAFNIAR